MNTTLYRVTLLILFLLSIGCDSDPVKRVGNGIIVKLDITDEKENPIWINIEVLSPTIIRTAIANTDSLLGAPSIIAKEKLRANTDFDTEQHNNTLEIKTDSLLVTLDLNHGEIRYLDKAGKVLLNHKEAQIIPFQDSIVGNQNRIKQNFNWAEEEVLYGLGQHELEQLNIRRQKIELTQQNTKVSNPVILSSKGYGMYWDNYSKSVFNGTGNVPYISSEIGDKIQYYFIKGHCFDTIISGFRDLTGAVPMLPKWALGYIQSRNRYKNRGQLLGVVEKHRRLNIPLDGIILDYLHWGDKGFGSMVFDPVDFPDPEGMIDRLHNELNCKLIVSTWPSFKKGIDNWELFQKKNLLLDLDLGNFGQVHDAFNPEAGELYYNLVKRSYLEKGVDAMWFDATEPERFEEYAKTTSFIGPTAKYLNLYSYYDMKNIYERQRADEDKRAFVLTRSAFAGQQKFGSVVWSGDIGVDFKTLREQIPTGLNFCMTGIPYWNTDIGGYAGGDPNNAEYQEVFTRWFQYGTFTPFFRAHGRRHPMESRSGANEVWSFGQSNTKILTDFIGLRYRLMPYIYTISHKVSAEGYTMMRALAFDFLSDENVLEINDQFMFGNSIMVCPVTESNTVQRKVYLPSGADWYDFWTGKKYEGGKSIIADAPHDIIPLFVRAGTVLPMGEVMQYTNERPNDKIEIRLYPGQDTQFILYEDENDNYNYEQGAYTEIPFTYLTAEKKLIIGERSGKFKGMLKNRTFDIVLVGEGKGTGLDYTKNPMKNVMYNGTQIEINL